jgi:ankyrin repeat protein
MESDADYKKFAKLLLKQDKREALVAMMCRIDLNRTHPKYPGESGQCTPLTSACEYRCVDLVELLLSHGADPNMPDGDGFTPLEIVIMGHCASYVSCYLDELMNIIQLLLQYGAQTKIGELVIEFLRDNSRRDEVAAALNITL